MGASRSCRGADGCNAQPSVHRERLRLRHRRPTKPSSSWRPSKGLPSRRSSTTRRPRPSISTSPRQSSSPSAMPIEFAHENQVLHLDIKPDNILVNRNGACKVSDFGVSELADAQGFRQGKWRHYRLHASRADERSRARRAHRRICLAAVTYEILTASAHLPCAASMRAQAHPEVRYRTRLLAAHGPRSRH